MKNNRNTDQRLMTNDQQAIETPALLSVAQRSVSLRPQGRLITHYSLSGRAAHRRAGMILLLVIALLVLLALLGTVFILMASTDRKSAYASNSSASLNMAQQGVLNTVRGLMLSQTLDTGGQTLAIGTISGGTFVPATPQIARFWDYPEVGAGYTGATYTPATANEFYQSVTAGAQPGPIQYAPSEPWLVNNPPWEPTSYYAPGEEVLYVPENAAFNAAGFGRYVYTGTPNAAPSLPTSGTWMGASSPAHGFAGYSASTVPPMPLVSAISPYLYDPTTGLYDLTWSLPGGAAASATNVVVPNAAVVESRWAYNTAYNPGVPGSIPVSPDGTLDAMWNMLPYSDPNGTRYRFAVRIMDTSSLLNLNTGWIANAYTSAGSNTAEATDPYGIYGAFIGSAPILNQANLNIDPVDFTAAASKGTPVQIGGGPLGTTPGRIGKYPNSTTFYSLPIWQSAMSEYELQFPSSGPAAYTYPTVPPAAFTTSLFGTNSAMDLLTGAGAGGEAFGSPFYSRVATLMPNTLGLEANGFGSGYRGLYTTYSFGRDVAPVNLWTGTVGSPWTTVTGTDTAPPKVNLNASVTTSPQLAALAGNLYTAMVASGYNAQHAREFLANYFTYRFGTSDYAASPAYLGAGNLLTVPMGGTTISATLPATVPAGVACMGTTAQPFLNEVEIKLTAKGGKTTVTDWAVEVVNPFPNATANSLPCSEYSISITGISPAIPLTGASLGGSTAVGKNMFGVLAYKGGTLATQAAGDGFVITSTGLPTMGGTVVVNLIRNGVVGGGGSVTVDSMSITIPATIPNNTSEYYDVSKENAGTSDGIWGCDSSGATTSTGTVITVGSIGSANPVVATSGEPGVILYDRWYSGDQVAPGATAGTNLANIDDLNCVARECAMTTETLPQQIDTNIAAAGPHTAYVPPANLGMYYVALAQTAGDPIIPVPIGSPAGTVSSEITESALYFDFAYDPRAAYTAVDAGFGDPEVAAANTGEIPPTFLSTATLTDRSQSNPTAQIALPEGATDLVRQPGKININTAGIDVLYSAFSEDGALWDGSVVPASPDVYQLVADAIGFRERQAAGVAITPLTQKVPTGYTIGANTGYSGFGGVGFQSPADLLVAFIPTVESHTAAGAPLFPTALPVLPATIQQRDAAWADVENFISVRSDTFAVYGLVQALRLNPAYSAEHALSPGTAPYAPVDWYNANQGIVVGSSPTNEVYNEGSISTDPTSQYAEFILEGSRRFIAIVDRSYCNNGAVVQPHIVALKILPQ